MSVIVIDASAMIDLVLDRPQSGRVSSALAQHDAACAPELLLVETASALWRLVRSGRVSADVADRALRNVERMPVRLIGHRRLMSLAWSDRQFLRISDAFYVACARQLEAPLLTTDERMARELERRIDIDFIA